MESKLLCRETDTYGRLRVLAKTFLIMKMIFILTAVMLRVQAAGTAQTATYHAENVPFEKVLSVVKSQTGYLFFYDPVMIRDVHAVTIQADRLPLETFIKKILQDQPLTFSIENKTIFLARKISFPLQQAQAGAIQSATPITGVVRDPAGNVIAGATVVVKGTKHSVRTDENGRFTINAEPGQTLLVSHVNMELREVVVTGPSDLYIEMRTRVSELNEVDVTISNGYTLMPKSQITGAASAISQKVYDQRVAVTGNFLESLEGKIPGLVYNSQSGDLSIRGVSSFNAVKKPLIVVDGFPSEIDINTINQNDIVSVSVLRDAAAASVYGVRASNGVIVVETKRGKSGAPVCSLRTTYAYQPKPDFNYLKLSSASEFTRLQYNELMYVENIPRFIFDLLKWPIGQVQATVFDFQDSLITDKQAQDRLAQIGSYDNLKDYKNLFYRNRQAQQIDFDVSGGNDRSSYLLGINYVNEMPQERKSNNDRFLLNLANTYKLNSRMKLDFRGTYTHANSEMGGSVSYNNFYPYEHIVDDNGKALATSLPPDLQYIGAITNENNQYIQTKGLYDQLYYPFSELTANTTSGRSMPCVSRED
ncbi:MAG: TonB-dependent receptor plug domain-containing protein [Chitinophagaceae bacterium]|nr:TonB-dependent receptor plug domain-containing protein [Chitinophagaceae bacterium]